jgi:DNA topoisomerase-2
MSKETKKSKEVQKEKAVEEIYQKKTQLEHILLRPDSYVGSVEMQREKIWVFNSELEQMELREVNFVPALYKIFDEIIVNAADNYQSK